MMPIIKQFSMQFSVARAQLNPCEADPATRMHVHDLQTLEASKHTWCCKTRSLTTSLKGTEVSVDVPDSHLVQHALSIAQPLPLNRVTFGTIFVNQTSFLNIFWFGGGLIMPGGPSKSTRSLKCTSSATQADPCDNGRCATPPIHQLRIVRKHPVDLTSQLIHTENWGGLGIEPGFWAHNLL